MAQFSAFQQALAHAQYVVAITGAGVSAESGIATFRGAGGLWRTYQAASLATPQAFVRTPSLVWENVDRFHQQAGSRSVVELHGSIWDVCPAGRRGAKVGPCREDRAQPLCAALAGRGAPDPAAAELPPIPTDLLPHDAQGRLLRPGVVWFGEALDPAVLDAAEAAVEACDLFITAGTSAVVYPAASFAEAAAGRGVPVAEFNLEPSGSSGLCSFSFQGRAGELLPAALGVEAEAAALAAAGAGAGVGPPVRIAVGVYISCTPPFEQELMAGGLAGAAGKTCVAPLERCKILFQTGKLRNANVPSALADIYRKEGVRGMFRGNGASVLRIIPYASFHFGTYEYYRRQLVEWGFLGATPESVPPLLDLCAGSTAGATAVLVTYPLDLVRTRLAFHTEANGAGGAAAHISSSSAAAAAAGGRATGLGAPSSGGGSGAPGRRLHLAPPRAAGGGPALTIRGMLAQTWRAEGPRGMYHGVGASFYGILPYAGLKFYVYQHLKQLYLHRGAGGPGDGRHQRLPVPVMLACGAAAGLVEALLHRTAAAPGAGGSSNGSGSGRHAFALRSTPQAVPSTAVGFTIYDFLKGLMDLPQNL
eukprot:scaffold19.g1843.t1